MNDVCAFVFLTQLILEFVEFRHSLVKTHVLDSTMLVEMGFDSLDLKTDFVYFFPL
jgi:hypothetical protein